MSFSKHGRQVPLVDFSATYSDFSYSTFMFAMLIEHSTSCVLTSGSPAEGLKDSFGAFLRKDKLMQIAWVCKAWRMVYLGFYY